MCDFLLKTTLTKMFLLCFEYACIKQRENKFYVLKLRKQIVVRQFSKTLRKHPPQLNKKTTKKRLYVVLKT
jgi:hypothetical protein